MLSQLGHLDNLLYLHLYAVVMWPIKFMLGHLHLNKILFDLYGVVKNIVVMIPILLVMVLVICSFRLANVR